MPPTAGRLRRLSAAAFDAIRTRLWPVPTAAVVLALVLGVVVPRLDRHVDDNLPSWLRDVIFEGDPDAARTVLDAVASSLITVTSLTFSLTVVTFQLASSQFSPRLLRTFAGDLVVQTTLALLLSTFTFSLTALRSVRSGTDGVGFVPRIAVSSAMLLAVCSVVALILFLAHVTQQIRVETMLRTVHATASATLATMLAERDSGGPRVLPAVPPGAAKVAAPASGFVTAVDVEDLTDATSALGLTLRLDVNPGASIVAGVPIGSAWTQNGTAPAEEVRTELDDAIRRGVRVGHERTSVQDVGYGLRQLTDVAVKALSPGINDPTTAVHALGHTAALLREVGRRDLGPVVTTDRAGVIRVALRRPTFAELLESAVEQPVRYGAADPQVADRLLALLTEVSWDAPADVRAEVLLHLDQLARILERADLEPGRRRRLLDAAKGLRAELAATQP